MSRIIRIMECSNPRVVPQCASINVEHHDALRASRPQLKREPLGSGRTAHAQSRTHRTMKAVR